MNNAEDQVSRQISERMRRASLARTQESRRNGGKKAWQTQRANLLAKIERTPARRPRALAGKGTP